MGCNSSKSGSKAVKNKANLLPIMNYSSVNNVSYLQNF